MPFLAALKQKSEKSDLGSLPTRFETQELTRGGNSVGPQQERKASPVPLKEHSDQSGAYVA